MTTEAPLDQTLQQLRGMYLALADLRATVLPRDPRLFALMAEGTLAQIEDLQKQIDFESGALEARHLEADLFLRAEGEEVAWPNISSSVLTAILDSLRKGVQNASEYLLGMGGGGGRRLEALKQACDFEVLTLEHGSLMVGLRIPFNQVTECIDSTKIKQAVDDYLAAASWAASDEGTASLDARFTDETYRRLLLAEVKRLAPRRNGAVSSLELSGRSLSGKSIRLTPQTGRHIQSVLQVKTEEQSREHTGRIREIDLDSLTFILRRAGHLEEVRCRYDIELQETIKGALDRMVRVSGTAGSDRRSTILRVMDLEVLEAEEG